MITIQRDQLFERGIDTKRGRGSLDKLHILIRQHINKSSAIFVGIFLSRDCSNNSCFVTGMQSKAGLVFVVLKTTSDFGAQS